VALVLAMALTMRPTGLGSGIDKDRQDYTVYTGGWDIGRIYEVRGGPEHLRWFWSFALHGPMTRSDRAATLEEAKAQFQKSWDEWKAWAKLVEMPSRVLDPASRDLRYDLLVKTPDDTPSTVQLSGGSASGGFGSLLF
jgi:hypothetical protein